MIKSGDIVLIDTNVILESHRLACWGHLTQEFELHTVTKVLEETQNGYCNRSGSTIAYGPLKASFHNVHDVTNEELLLCSMKYPKAKIMDLDPGERDLITYATSLNKECWLLCSPDKAAMRTTHVLGYLDSVVSLETMLSVTSLQLKSKLKENYTESWNSRTKTSIKLGAL
ncbi:hypothetical protein QJ367_001027 [Vibrio vulnificus]|nr:hypothetical protein [Vibrio vulnificus]